MEEVGFSVPRFFIDIFTAIFSGSFSCRVRARAPFMRDNKVHNPKCRMRILFFVWDRGYLKR